MESRTDEQREAIEAACNRLIFQLEELRQDARCMDDTIIDHRWNDEVSRAVAALAGSMER